MAADKLKYAIGNAASTTGSSSIGASDTSAPLTSTTNFQAKSGEGGVLLDEGQATEEIAYATALSSGALTIPLANRGLEGTTAAAHSSGYSVKGVLTAGMWNDLIDALKDNVLDKTDGIIKSLRMQEQSSTPSTPASGYDKLYFKTDNLLYRLDSSGNERPIVSTPAINLLRNGNFINNSTNGYGGTPDRWSAGAGTPIQGGFPEMTKQQIIDLLGITDGDIEGLWNLNNSYSDLSSNGYNLTASGSPVFSDSGLMAKALDLESGSSQYASVADASSANLEISGSQTWFAYIKPESLANMEVLAKYTGGTVKVIEINTSNKAFFKLDGLTTNSLVTSDVILEAGKWYLIIGVYDSANSLLKIYVNGVKTSVTASGSASDTNGEFNVGRLGGAGSLYYDGLVQCAGVLSVALSDDQANRLWAFSSYRGLKQQRSGSNVNIYQQIDEAHLEKIRGRTITLRALVYQNTASTAILRITDSSGSTDSTASSTTGSWTTITVTRTIPSTVTYVQAQLRVDTTDGIVWFKEVSLYEGSGSVPYSHSMDDWVRFPGLLRMDIRTNITGYKYEENRWHTYTPVVTGFSSTTATTGRFLFSGKVVHLKVHIAGTSNATGLTFTVPIYSNNTVQEEHLLFRVMDNGSNLTTPGLVTFNGSVGTCYKSGDRAAFTGSGAKQVTNAMFTYEAV